MDTPVVRASIDESSILITQEYERSHLIGGTASTAIGDWIFRSELAWETSRHYRIRSLVPDVRQSGAWSFVIEIDFQGWTDQLISLQWFQTNITGKTTGLINHKQGNTATFL